MLALLPLLALGVCILGCKARLCCWRTAVVSGAVVWGAVLVIETELLSALRLLNVTAVLVAWLLTLVLGSAFILMSPHPRALLRFDQQAAWLRRAPRSSIALLATLSALVLVLGGVAVLPPPNTWDSMTYHMARVAHWIQNATLAPYPTHELRQLYLQPGAEMVVLHLQMLSGGDHLAGLVQWTSMIGALVGTSLIAREFGASQQAQLGASIVAASVPIGILESTSTQNDYVVTFWLVCVAVFGMRMLRGSSAAGAGLPAAAALGTSLGLALLTKGTAYIFVLPVLTWIAFRLVAAHGWRALAPLALAAGLALALNVGFFFRGMAFSSSLMGIFDQQLPSPYYLNAGLTPALLVSNLVRDLGLNVVATPFTPLNLGAERGIQALHGWLGVDPADPRTTWGSETITARAPGLAFDENFAGNPVQLLLLGAVLVAVCVYRGRLEGVVGWYALALTSGFVLFAAVLRWQPWHARLELPLFVLSAPLVAVVVERITPRLSVPMAVLLLLSMLPWVVYNQARPLVGPRSIFAVSRSAQYFTNQPWLRPTYLGAIDFLAQRGCGRIGLLPGEWWEYPLWALLRESVTGPVRIAAVGVNNASAGLPVTDVQPCALLWSDPGASPESFEYRGRTYHRQWQLEDMAILTTDGI